MPKGLEQFRNAELIRARTFLFAAAAARVLKVGD
jgi:hypothetical protein